MDPPAVRPLVDLELREKNERAARDERKTMVSNFKVPCNWMTSQVRSKGLKWPLFGL